MSQSVQIPEPRLSQFLFGDTRTAWFWLLIRLYVGYEWIMAGWEKVQSPAWVGPQAGTAITGFLNGVAAKAAGAHPDVAGWYAAFIQSFVLHHTVFFSYLISYGELLVGVALVLGIFTGLAAFFGSFMNLNYLFAGTVSTNPFLALLGLFLILAWRVAGWYGLDQWVLPAVGTPWQKGSAFKR